MLFRSRPNNKWPVPIRKYSDMVDGEMAWFRLSAIQDLAFGVVGPAGWRYDAAIIKGLGT